MFEDQEQLEHEYVVPPLEILKFSMEPESKIQSDHLFVAFYGISSLYASTLVDTNTPIARVNFQKAKQRSLASVYSDPQKRSAFIIFNQQIPSMKEVHFADFVTKNFSFKNLIIFTKIAKGMLQTDDGINLKTSWGLDLHGPKYNQGISGPAADLLTWAQINGINATCYIGIYSDYQITRQIVDNIFQKVSNILPVQSKFNISKQIKNYNTLKHSSKLYL